MQYRDIPYEYNEWTTHTGKSASGYSCEAFSEFPYDITKLTSETEDGIKERIDDLRDHKAEYEARRELSNKAAQSFYNSMGKYKGD